MNAKAVPIPTPLLINASAIGIVPKALEYKGIPTITATITLKGLSEPAIFAKAQSGTQP